jgi:hypothetical protein
MSAVAEHYFLEFEYIFPFHLTIYFLFSRYGRSVQEDTTVTQKPRFLGPLKGTNKIVEGQRAHFEARVEPQNDITLQVSKTVT